jgi:GTP-binding protein
MPLPVVAIVGRPNVGKSSLFNALVRSRVAIVDPTPGVTRDRVGMVLRAGSRRCELVDTGGIGVVDQAGLAEDIEEQISVAMHEADLILFVVDVQAGLIPADLEIAERLRRVGKPVLLVANKADSPALEHQAAVFYRLGFADPFPVAAETSRGIGELRETIGERVPETPAAEDDDVIRLAIVGRTNAGKSTLVNRLIGSPRMIVSDVPGTTRDAVDLEFELDGQRFVAVDTAGMRKRRSVSGSADFYGQARSERAIRRAHVVIFLIDASEPLGRVERNIGQRIKEACRPYVVALSKWDLVEGGRSLEDYQKYLEQELPMLREGPQICLSAQEGLRVVETLRLAAELHEQAGRRLGTGELNRLVREAMERKGPPVRGGRTGKILYAAQIDAHPPTVVLFVNEARLLTPTYRRYLVGYLQEHGPFPEVPIRLLLRQREARRGKGR